jgi:hypothetical protein
MLNCHLAIARVASLKKQPKSGWIALQPASGITPEFREKLIRISPAAIDPALKKDRAAVYRPLVP